MFFQDNDNVLMIGEDIMLCPNTDASNPIAEDDRLLTLLKEIAEDTPADEPRRTVHLQLLSQTSLWALQTMDLPPVVNERFDVNPFTLEDAWAKKLLVRLPGIDSHSYPPLDRRPIDAKSSQRVHLVVCGFGQQAAAIALHAALIAHFPNYNSHDDKPIRTRITVLGNGIAQQRDAFIARHQHLFDNSFYRFVDVASRKTELHTPMYNGRRPDFVDVEWEFVDGSPNDPLVRQKLSLWANDVQQQQLSIAIAYDDDEKSLSIATTLPQAVYDSDTTVYLQQKSANMAQALKRSRRYRNIYCFGDMEQAYDTRIPLVKMAKLLNYCYDCCYGSHGTPTEMPAAEVEAAWQRVHSLKMRLSNIYNVMTIATKMHTLGHDTDDADTFYAINQQETEALAATEHNRWSVDRLITGTRPCTDQERQEIKSDISKKEFYKRNCDAHYDLCSYDELQNDKTGINVKEYDYQLIACIPLIVKSFYELNNDEQ